MKDILLIFLAIILSSLLIGGCGLQTQSTIAPTITFEPTETLTPTATIKPTATFLPAFTPPLPISSYRRPTTTLTPLPKDIFDNFQGLSGNCIIKTAFGASPKGEEFLALNSANVSINFDRSGYFSRDLIKLSAGMNQDYVQFEHIYGIVIKVIVENPALKRNSFYLYDDGTHGDQRTGDGIYTNTFDNTLNAGIYKFYFRLSGHNKNTGETFIRECFLAKTVNPIPSPTATLPPGVESKSCKEIDPTDPIVVRPEGVGGSDSSELGWYAFDPKAVSMGDSILAIWGTGFDGQKPKPNAYMRVLDGKVTPVGEVKLLFERNIIDQTTLVNKDNTAIFSYCGRYNIGDDRYTSAFLDPDGNLISEQVRSPTNRACARSGASIWTGSRILFSLPNVNYPSQGQVLDIADANGNSISWKMIDSNDGITSPLAVGHGRVLMLVGTFKNDLLSVHRFDLKGNELGEPVILEPLTYEVDGKIAIRYFTSAYVVPTVEGWMVLASLSDPGIYVAQLAPDGSLISNSVIEDSDLLYQIHGFTDVISYKGGAVVLEQNYVGQISGKSQYESVVLFISEDGTINQRWYPKEGEQPASGSFFEHQGRLFLIYTNELEHETPQTNQVLVRELKCR